MTPLLLLAAAVACAGTLPAVPVQSPVSAPRLVLGTSTDPGAVRLGDATLHLGRATAADVRRAEGRRPDARLDVVGSAGEVGYLLRYTTRTAAGECYRHYSFPTGSTRLSDVESDCASARTAAGVRPGLGTAAAAVRAGAAWRTGGFGGWQCEIPGSSLSVGGPRAWTVAWTPSPDPVASPATVTLVGAYGPRSTAAAAYACSGG